LKWAYGKNKNPKIQNKKIKNHKGTRTFHLGGAQQRQCLKLGWNQTENDRYRQK
jgi:hypothetical protein